MLKTALPALILTVAAVPVDAAVWIVSGSDTDLANHIVPYSFRLEIADAAVARGSFSLVNFGSFFPSMSPWMGDLQDFVSLDTGSNGIPEHVSPDFLRGNVRLNATFGPSGAYAITFVFHGVSEESEGTLTQDGYDIRFSGDGNFCHAPSNNGLPAAYVCEISADSPASRIPAPGAWPVMALAMMVGAWRRWLR